DDHDLDLSWQVLQQPEQGIEWFDGRGNLLVATGYPFPFVPLDIQAVTALSSSQGSVSLRRLTLLVYETTSAGSPLLGYVRVTESTEYVYDTLRQLQRGFILGELCALTLTAIAGLGLIHQVLKPIKRSYAQLQQFTGDASHELRTPLAVIKTSVEVLQTHRQNFAKDDQNKLAHILSATNQMGNLVNDFLLLARQDGERKSENFILIPLDEILEDVLPWMELTAEKKQLFLTSNLASGIYIKGNPDLLKRVFINLLDNAIKYTNSPGKITLTLNSSAKVAVVIVQDTGVGIAPEQIPLMFDRFWRACLARSPQVTGSGLGLAIVQSIVKAHSGQIQVNSELGKGTTIRVKFPLVSGL
ncbi:MAG: sensor histidine kinase, partial [Synechocystis sp.]